MDENKVFINNILYKKVAIEPKYLNKNIEKYILNNLKFNLEGKCIKEGFVLPDSIKIVRRSVGKTYGCDFSGNIVYDIVYSAKICNPAENDIISCVIKNINKLGVLAENGPLSIIIAKQYHQDKSIFKNIEIGDYINIKVLGKKFELNDFKISVIGQIVQEGKIKTKKKIKVISNNHDFKNVNIKYEKNIPLMNDSNANADVDANANANANADVDANADANVDANADVNADANSSDPEEYLENDDIENDFDYNKEYDEDIISDEEI